MKIGRFMILLVPLMLSVLFLACGEDSQQAADEGPRLSPAQSSLDAGLENRAPEITTIRFEPAQAMPGNQLRVRVGATDPDRDPIEFGYTWKINGRRASGLGSVFDVPSNLRKGDRIEVAVIASDGHANSKAVVETVLIRNRRPSVQEIRIHVRASEGSEMGHWVADPTAQDPDGDKITFRYSWIVNGRPIGVETAELAREHRKRGDEIRLVVWARDGDEESAPLESAPFTIGNSPPDINSRPPATDPSGLFAYAVQASDPDGDRGLRYSLKQGPNGMAIDAFSGELRWKATLEDAGEHIVEIAVDDRHGGVTTQTFYVHVATGPASQK